MGKVKCVLGFVFIISLVCSVSLVWGGGGKEQESTVAKEGEGFSWNRYEGTTIVVNFPSDLAYNKIVDLLPEFEAKTGMKVEADVINYMRMHDKQVLELNKPIGDYDVVSLVCMWKTEYVAGDMLQEMDGYFNNTDLVDPEYDFDDMVEGFVTVTGSVGGAGIYKGGLGSKLYAVPFGAETSIMAYRKDLFEKYGLTVPETYEELAKASSVFGTNEPGVYGLTMRAASGHHTTGSWLRHGNPHGAKVFNENWEPVFDSPASIKTINFMKEMVKYGPPGMTSFTVGDSDNAFLQGKASLYIDHDKIMGMVKDPAQSKVMGKVGFALHPKAEKYSSSTGGFGVGIPANSKNKEAAFLFIQWMTSKGVAVDVAKAGGTPNRYSTFEDPELKAMYPEWKIYKEQLKYADPDWRPIIDVWGEINVQFLGVAVNKVLIGEMTAEEAMASIKEPVRNIMDKAGYYDGSNPMLVK